MERCSNCLLSCRAKESGRCAKNSKRMMYFMNTLVMLSGIILLTASIVLSTQSGDLIAGLGSIGLIGPSVAGGILMAMSLFGCCGVYYRNRLMLVVYFIVLLTLSGFTIAAGVILLFFVDDVNNVDGEASADFAGQVEGQINDYIVAVFNECCADAQDGIDRILSCIDPAFVEGDACFTFVDTYQDALDRIQNAGLCTTFENININVNGSSVPLVGDVADGGCAGGDGNLFVQEFSKLVAAAIEPVGGAILGVGILLLLTSIASLVLVCADRETYNFEFRSSYADGTVVDAKAFDKGMAPPPAYPRNKERERRRRDDGERRERRERRRRDDEGGRGRPYYERRGESMTGMDDNPRYRRY